jgi:hypothetical protein
MCCAFLVVLGLVSIASACGSTITTSTKTTTVINTVTAAAATNATTTSQPKEGAGAFMVRRTSEAYEGA